MKMLFTLKFSNSHEVKLKQQQQQQQQHNKLQIMLVFNLINF